MVNFAYKIKPSKSICKQSSHFKLELNSSKGQIIVAKMYRIQTGVGGCWLGRTIGNDNFFPTENDRIFASHVEFLTVTPSFTFEVIYFNTISLRTSEITWKIRRKSAEFYVSKYVHKLDGKICLSDQNSWYIQWVKTFAVLIRILDVIISIKTPLHHI